MSALHLADPNTAAVLEVQSLDRLTDIALPGVEAVVWARTMAPELQLRLKQTLPVAPVENARATVRVLDVEACVRRVFENWGGIEPFVQEWLAADIARLSGQLAAILSVKRVRLRIEMVDDDACRKFHKDWVQARLICTYLGPGTQYGLEDVSGGQPVVPATVGTGCPILLRGKNWPSDASTAVLHRSPPIRATGERRLVVVIDEPLPDTPT